MYIMYGLNGPIRENNRPIDLVGKVFANGPGDRGSILGRVIPKTQRMLLA